MRELKVTIIIAVYNVVDTLGKCIHNIDSQTYNNIELIIIDGGSTDGTIKILEKNSSSISYWSSEKDSGVYNAWNKGIKKSTGDWICFLGGDDFFWNENVIKDIVTTLNEVEDEIRVVYSKIALLTQSDELLCYVGDNWESSKEKFKQLMSIPHPGTMHKAELFREFGGFDESFKIAGDYELLLRELKNRDAMFVSDVIAVGMRQGGISSNPKHSLESLKEVRRATKKHNSARWPWLWYISYLKIRVRSVVWIILGEKNTRRLMDSVRALFGKPRIWVKTNNEKE